MGLQWALQLWGFRLRALAFYDLGRTGNPGLRFRGLLGFRLQGFRGV